MPEARATGTYLASTTLVSTAPALLYGAVLSARAGGASMIVYNAATATAVSLSARRLPLYTGAATGTTAISFSMPMEMSSGIFASLSAKGVGLVWYRKRC